MKLTDLAEARAALSAPAKVHATGTLLSKAISPELTLEGRSRISVVSFTRGSRTHWHAHDGGQILVVLSGTCRFGKDSGEVTLVPAGSVAIAEPGERHWHGADETGEEMTHLSITIGETDWQEAVTGS